MRVLDLLALFVALLGGVAISTAEAGLADLRVYIGLASRVTHPPPDLAPRFSDLKHLLLLVVAKLFNMKGTVAFADLNCGDDYPGYKEKNGETGNNDRHASDCIIFFIIFDGHLTILVIWQWRIWNDDRHDSLIFLFILISIVVI